jgi:GntR family transcriptional regulator
MVVADSAVPARPADRAALLRPTLEQAAREARQLELDPDTVLTLFATILKEAK